jgi:hypothetical protein
MARPSHRLLAALTVVAVLSLAAPALPAGAASAGRVVSVTTLAPSWVRTGGPIPSGVRIQVRGAVPFVVVESRILDAHDAILWSDTQTRTGLNTAAYEFPFAGSTRNLGLAAGAYTLESSVKAGGATVSAKPRTVFIVDASTPRVPVCVVVRVNGTPAVLDGTAGGATASSFTATDTQDLARLASVRPELHLTAAVPPFLLEAWSAEKGALASDTAGVSDRTGTPGSDALDALRDAVAAGMPVLRAGYAEPDMSALASAPAEVSRQLQAGDAVRARSLSPDSASPPSAVATGFGVESGLIPASAASVLTSDGVSFVVADSRSLAPSRGSTIGPSPYRVTVRSGSGASATMTVLVLDRVDAASLADPTGADALAASLYARASSKQGRLPVVLEVPVGDGGIRTVDLQRALDALALLPWVRLVDAPAAASLGAAGTATLQVRPADPTPAPATLTSAVVRARKRVDAYTAAIGSSLETATARALMLSESRVWAGVDGAWRLSERGQAFAAAADEAAWGVLSKVKVQAPSVTLPGSEGRVPVSVVNGSDRTLRIVLEARSRQMRPRAQRIAATVEPGENILSVPVALGAATTGKLDLVVTAGDLEIASTSATVTASYLDRIVLLAAAVLVLIVLLLVIRRRMARGARTAGTRKRARER